MAYVRVKDQETKHEFDVLETDWRIGAGLLEPVKSDRYPVAAVPRPTKHYLKPAARRAATETKEA